MELRMHLPGRSAAEDTALARKGAELAVKRSYGRLAAAPLPAHTSNPCDDQGCTFLGTEVVDGVTWLVYLCGAVVEYYKA